MSGGLLPWDQINDIMDNTTTDANDGGTNGIEDKIGIVTLAASFLLYKIGTNHSQFFCLSIILDIIVLVSVEEKHLDLFTPFK